MMDASINGRTAEGYAATAKVKLEMTAQNITARLSTVQQQVEFAQGHLELLGHLNDMNFFEKVVYSISRSPITMKILSYSVELLCYHYAESPAQFNYFYYY
jgi:acyl carrier protein phosphodiesterase